MCLHNLILMEEENLKPKQRTYVTSKLVDRDVDDILVPREWRNEGEGAGFYSIGKQGSNNTKLVGNRKFETF